MFKTRNRWQNFNWAPEAAFLVAVFHDMFQWQEFLGLIWNTLINMNVSLFVSLSLCVSACEPSATE